MDGFFREVHSSQGERTGVLECAVEIYDDRVTNNFKDIIIPQFRKVYDRRKNKDQFIETKEGHNHLLLIMNGGINLVPIGKKYKSSVWKLPLHIEKVTYYNDRLVYVLVNKVYGRELRLLVDTEDYSVYRNELIVKVDEQDHDNYAWQRVNTDGEKCGAILDHQGYEYRLVDGKLFPHYFFRRMDFRCFDLSSKQLVDQASLTKELLINNIAQGVKRIAGEKLKKKKAMINRKAPYDSSFWKYFNDIQDVELTDKLSQEDAAYISSGETAYDNERDTIERRLRLGNHFTQAFTRADTLFGSLTPDRACYDVGFYDLSVKIDPVKEWLAGTSQIRFKMVNSSDSIRIDLFEELAITSIVFEDQPLAFERDLDAVYVTFPFTLEAGQVHAINVSYEGHPLEPDFHIWASGFLWDEDADGHSFSQSLCQGYGAKAWWPVKNHLSDEPDSMSIHLTVPKGLMAISNGLLDSTSSGNGKTSFHWKVRNPINNYNVAAHIGNYASYEQTFGKLPLSLYYLKEDSAVAKEKLQMIYKMLDIYQKYFGPYPFPEDGFKLVQAPNPMEHQSCVSIGRYFDDQLILHETAHEWWGNSVSIRDNADIWIHEAFATYAEALYIEETLGYTIGQEYLNARKNDVRNDFPLVGVRHVNHFHYRIEDKYFKGALMLNTLRHLVNNDELWFATIKGIQETFKHAFIDTDTLVAYFNEQLGKDYSPFFHLYLYTTRIPMLLTTADSEGATLYKWDQMADDLKMSLKVGDTFLTPSNMWQKTSISLADQAKHLESDYLIRVEKSR